MAIGRIANISCLRVVPFNATLHSDIGLVVVTQEVATSCFVDSVGYYGPFSYRLNLGLDSQDDFCYVNF